MKAALKRLADIEGRPEIANRKERTVFSFCIRSPEMIEEFRQTQVLTYDDLTYSHNPPRWLEPLLAIEKENNEQSTY